MTSQDTRIWLYDSDSRPIWLWCDMCEREAVHEIIAVVRPRPAHPGADLLSMEVRCEDCGHLAVLGFMGIRKGRPVMPGWST